MGKGRSTKNLTSEEKARIVELYQQGIDILEIAAKMGREKGAVYRALRQVGALRPRGAKASAKASSSKMARAGRGPAKTSSWRGQLAKLVRRIRNADPGVTHIEIDMGNGRYTVNRTMSERGEIS